MAESRIDWYFRSLVAALTPDRCHQRALEEKIRTPHGDIAASALRFFSQVSEVVNFRFIEKKQRQKYMPSEKQTNKQTIRQEAGNK